jgi:hypothetical protein
MLDWKHTYDASFGPNSFLKPSLPLLNKFTQRPPKKTKKRKKRVPLPHFNGGREE